MNDSYANIFKILMWNAFTALVGIKTPPHSKLIYIKCNTIRRIHNAYASIAYFIIYVEN